MIEQTVEELTPVVGAHVVRAGDYSEPAGGNDRKKTPQETEDPPALITHLPADRARRTL